jgi:hypothetical protein
VVTLDATQTMIRPTHVVGAMPCCTDTHTHTDTQACDTCHCCRARPCLMLMCHADACACAVVSTCSCCYCGWPHGAPSLMSVRLLGGCETCSPRQAQRTTIIIRDLPADATEEEVGASLCHCVTHRLCPLGVPLWCRCASACNSTVFHVTVAAPPLISPILWVPSRVCGVCVGQLRALFSGNGLSQPQSLHRDSTFPGMW